MANREASTFTREIVSSVTGELFDDLLSFLKRKTRNSEIAERIRQGIGYNDLADESKDIIELAATKAKIDYPVEKKTIKEVLGVNENRKIIFSVLVNPFEESDLKKLSTQITFDEFVTHPSERERFKHFLKEFLLKIETLKKERFSSESQQILNEVNSVKNTLEKGIKRLESKIDQAPALTGANQIDDFIETKIDELESLKKTKKLQEVRTKARQFLDDIPHLDKSNWEAIVKANLLIAQTYLALEELNTQIKANPYLDDAIRFNDDEKKNRELIVLKHLLNNNFDEGLAAVDEALEDDPGNKTLKIYKAQLLLGMEEHDLAISIAKELCDNSLISRFYFRAGDYARAEEFLQKSVKEKEEVEFNDVMFRANLKAHTYSEKDLDLEYLHQAINELRSYYDETDIELDEQKGLIESRLGVLYAWASEYLESYKFLKKAHERLPTDSFFLSNLIYACLNAGKPKEAISFIDKYLENFEKNDLKYLKYELIINNNLRGTVSSEIEEILNDTDTPDSEKIKLIPLYIKALVSDVKITKAEEYLDEVESLYGETSGFKKAKAHLADEVGEINEVIQFLKEAIELEDEDHGDIITKRILADVYYSQENKYLTEAIELYKELSNPYINDLNLKRLALCYYRVEDYVSCLKLCDQIIELHDQNIEQYLDLRASIYLENDNFVPAEADLKKLVSGVNPGIKHKVHLINCLYRQNKIEDANDLLKVTRKKLNDGDENLFLLTGIQLELGHYENALQDSYRALLSDNPSLRSKSQYFGIYMNIALERPDLIAEDDKYYQAALEAKKALLQSDSEEFLFKEIEVPTDNFDELQKKLLEHLPSSNSRRKMMESYDNFRLPVSYLSNVFNKKIYTIYNSILNHNWIKIWCNSGLEEDYDKQCSNAKESNNIVIGLISLLTLQKLGLLTHLVESFDNILVNQVAYDELHESRVSLNTKEDELTIYAVGDNIGTSTTPRETIVKYEKELGELLEFISKESNINLIGKSIGRENIIRNLDEADQVYGMIGELNCEAIEEAAHNKFHLFSDQQLVRVIADKLNVGFFSVFGFLNRIKDEDRIKSANYHFNLIRLLLFNYNFLQINFETIITGIKGSGYLNTSESLACFKFLKEGNIAPSSLLGILCIFVDQLWNQSSIGVHMKIKWTKKMLESVFHNRLHEPHLSGFIINPANYISIKEDANAFLEILSGWREKLRHM